MKWFMKILLITASLAIVIVLVNLGCSAVRGGYESAPYKVLKRDGSFELREYPALMVAQTSMQNADNGFMRLFRYIDGQNASQQKIPMTTPVFFSGRETNRIMSFVMPENMNREKLPDPKDQSVTLQKIPGGTFAVYRFSGGRNAANQTEAASKLETWLTAQKLSSNGELIYAYFDPPWTPSFFRRNEVMLRVLPASPALQPSEETPR